MCVELIRMEDGLLLSHAQDAKPASGPEASNAASIQQEMNESSPRYGSSERDCSDHPIWEAMVQMFEEAYPAYK